MSHDIPLGKTVSYPNQYDASLLFPVGRNTQRLALGLGDNLPFVGADVWNAYEVSWLNTKGKPQVALAKFVFPCESPQLIESKSLKLYLNSFNDARFASMLDVMATIKKDLSHFAGVGVDVSIVPVQEFPGETLSRWQGTNLDHLDISCNEYQVNPHLLQLAQGSDVVSETLTSDLLKSNCLVTSQPDWASLKIEYQGAKIDHASMLRYIVSYRHHQGFHEGCVEQIFLDIMAQCTPAFLCVEARYTRRGGLDINPIRATHLETLPSNRRLCRQ